MALFNRGLLGGLLALVLVSACQTPVTPTPAPQPIVSPPPPAPAPPPEPTPAPSPGPPPSGPPAPAPPPPNPPRADVWRLAIEKTSPEFPLSGEVPLEVSGESARWGTWQGKVMLKNSTSLLVLFYDGGPPHTGTLNIFKSGDSWLFSFNGIAGQASGRVVQMPANQTAAP